MSDLLPDHLILTEQANDSIISEPPGVRRMVFEHTGEDVGHCSCDDIYDPETGEHVELTCECEVPVTVYNLPLPWMHYKFKYWGYRFKTYEMTQIFFSDTPIGEDLENTFLTRAPLPNLYPTSICMPGSTDENRVSIINHYWETAFNYDGDMEEIKSYEDLAQFIMMSPTSPKIHGREDLFFEWEKLSVDDLLRVPWRYDERVIERRTREPLYP